MAVEFAYGYGIETVSDPDKDLDPDKAVKKMVAYIIQGISPLEDAPEVPAEYWEKLQQVAQRRITLAGYRIADLVIAAADQIAIGKIILRKGIGDPGLTFAESHHRQTRRLGLQE